VPLGLTQFSQLSTSYTDSFLSNFSPHNRRRWYHMANTLKHTVNKSTAN